MGRGKGVRSVPSGEKEMNSSRSGHGAGKFQRSEQGCMRSGSCGRRCPVQCQGPSFLAAHEKGDWSSLPWGVFFHLLLPEGQGLSVLVANAHSSLLP